MPLNSAVSKDKDRQSFKLRPGMDKKIVIYVQQTSNKELAIERLVLCECSPVSHSVRMKTRLLTGACLHSPPSRRT